MHTHNTKPEEGKEIKEWQLIGHSSQIADTGDYDGCYEITNGKVSIYSNDDDDEALQPVVDALNKSGCNFYLDDSYEFENYLLKQEISELRNRLSPSPPKASQEQIEEKNEWELFCMMCEGIIFPLAGNLTVSQLYEQFKAQGYKITKEI